MHGNDKNVVLKSILIQNHFLIAISWIKYVYLILCIILVKIYMKAKKNKINYFKFVLYYGIIRNAYFVWKNDKRNNLIAFHGSFIPKILKNNQNLKNMQAFDFIVAMATGMAKWYWLFFNKILGKVATFLGKRTTTLGLANRFMVGGGGGTMCPLELDRVDIVTYVSLHSNYKTKSDSLLWLC